MRQEVNLYTLEFRRGEQPLSSRTIVRAALGFIAVLVLVEAWAVWRLADARNELALLSEQEQTVTARLDELKRSQPFSQRGRLESEVENLRAEVKRREELKALIGGQNLGNAGGFSPHLIAMARQASRDVSLTEIRLLNGGDYLELAGWTRQPEAVPLYLHSLREESSFEKVKFGVLGIKEEQEFGQKLRFTLGKPEGESS